ncbi:MAG: AAA family ATPase [Nitrososphaerota archaeon]|jgi:ABC-type cobalamin/Fe3+-siderophores transport system ATPase subunit/SAM-dependent methyltransferase|nr:AAA family ATPase [Nitrososphaerota archaeon]
MENIANTIVNQSYLVTLNETKLADVNLHFYQSKNKPFSYKRNFIIGPNGGGKSRLLKVVKENVKEIYKPSTNATFNVVHLDFSSIVGTNGAQKGKEDKEGELIEYAFYGRPTSLDDFLPLIESDAENLVAAIFAGKPPGKKAVQDFNRVTTTINKNLAYFLNAGLSLTKADVDPVEKAGKLLNTNSFSEEFAKMSPGEKHLFYIALFLAILATHKKSDDNIVLLIDEPELHLHYDMVRRFIESIETVFKDVPIWVASHSIHLLTRYTFAEITYIADNTIHRGTSDLRTKITDSILGVEKNSRELLLDVESQEYLDFVQQCFDDPESVNAPKDGWDDPQFKIFLSKIDARLQSKIDDPINVLDYGAGQGRFGDMLKRVIEKKELDEKLLTYDTFRLETECKNDFRTRFPNGADYGTEIEIPNNTFHIVLLVNTLHEIAVDSWRSTFETIYRSLKPDGYIFFCEAQILSNGEKPTQHGFLVLGENELENLFRVKAVVSQDNKIIYAQICRKNLEFITNDVIHSTVNKLSINALASAKELTDNKENARKRAFYAMQHINAELALDILSPNLKKELTDKLLSLKQESYNTLLKRNGLFQHRKELISRLATLDNELQNEKRLLIKGVTKKSATQAWQKSEVHFRELDKDFTETENRIRQIDQEIDVLTQKLKQLELTYNETENKKHN